MDDCCRDKERELALLRRRRARVLKIVLGINAAMFLIEFSAGVAASSTALMADSVDMLGDALVYALSLYALDRSARWRAGAAVTKGLVILAFGIGVLIHAANAVLSGSVPLASLMAWFGALALTANLACLRLLWPLRTDDVNMRSTFECSRNDVIANVGVLLAAFAVALTDRSWPDITVGLIVAALFLRSALSVLREAWPQMMERAGSRRAA